MCHDLALLFLCYSFSFTLCRLSDFLETLDEGSFFTSPRSNLGTSLLSSPTYSTNVAQPTATTTNPTSAVIQHPSFSSSSSTVSTSASPATQSIATTMATTVEPKVEGSSSDTSAIVLPSATKTEKFLLTAADQESGSRDERLNRVIRSKYEAGLLKPYNYVKGYARLSRWMDRKYVVYYYAIPPPSRA